jgi:glutamate carboxypeptidase
MSEEAMSEGVRPHDESQSMTVDDVTRLRDHLGAHKGELIDFVEQLALIESPTLDPESQRPIQALLTGRLEAIGFRVRHLRGAMTGGHLWARPLTPAPGAPFQMLIGHSDTVWPCGTLGSMPVVRDPTEGVLRGPGVFDMKCGVAQIVFALEALHALGLRPSVTPAVFVNSDEETGSSESYRHVVRLSRHASRAMLLEPALGSTGLLKTGRRGIGQFEVTIHGQSAHSGLDPGKGASAILELSFVIQKLHALSDLDRGITVNVGEISGGTRPNVVAARARAVVDARVMTMEDARWLEDQVRRISATVPGTRVEIKGAVDRPPMERTPRNQALWRAVRDCGTRLGLELEQGISGGGSDGNTTSLYCATIDGMGAVGDGAHAAHEFMNTEHVVDRTVLLAMAVMLPSSAVDVDEL